MEVSTLISNAQTMGATISEAQAQKLLDFIELLARWNKTYNLTSIDNETDMVRLHLLDSLSIAKFITGPTLLDVGSGAGLPGIPLAIALPEIQITLLDSRGKKTRFMEYAVRTLKLENVVVVQSRVEDFSPDQNFRQIVSRAFATLEKFYAATKTLLDTEGELLAMKGMLPKEEITAVEAVGAKMLRKHQLSVPGVDAQRHLIVFGS